MGYASVTSFIPIGMSLQGRTAKPASKSNDHAKLAPAGTAETKIFGHELVAPAALSRIDPTNGTLQNSHVSLFDPHMNTPPKLTDRNALLLHRARAARELETFLFDQVADEMHERLAEVNRPFTKAAVVSGFPDYWRGHFPNADHFTDEDVLNLELGAYDLVVHAMAMHWANDLVGQLVQCRRALKPDGMLIAMLFGGNTLNELRSALAEAEIAVLGGLSPRIAPMAEIRDLGGLLQRAGLALPVADALPLRVSYGDIFALFRDLRNMGETNALLQRHKGALPRALLKNAASIYDASFKGKDGRLEATFEVIFLTGWAPDESQQKPLRPGSAQARLADALGAVEKKLD